MYKSILIAGLLLAFLGFQAAAQSADAERAVISGDLTTIYTLGNASKEQKIDDANATGAYFNDPVTGTRKNGFYTAANLYATFRPLDWFESYFKLYAISRPGSFYMPLQMENMGKQDFALTLDAVYAKANLFGALNLGLPVDLFVKGGKYKAQAAQYGIISKYKTEQVLYMMNTKTDFTYELGISMNDPVKLIASFAANYLFDESVQRLYDEDGGLGNHGDQVLNEYAPQFLFGIRIWDLNNISAELLYGQNVSNIYSGNAAGFSAKYLVNINDNMSVPIGLQFGLYEKNIDLLGQAAVPTPIYTGGNTTVDFRLSWAAALGAGLQMSTDSIDLEFNIAGAMNSIKHIYRNDINVIKTSVDAMVTIKNNYFIGGGLILGTLTDVEWKTNEDSRDKESYYTHTFTLEENMGFEAYAGINLSRYGKVVVGFNQNKGLSLNNMLEAKHEGQMKYKQEGSNWAQDKLAQAGGLYFKLFFRF
jgi:hypothetical protein